MGKLNKIEKKRQLEVHKHFLANRYIDEVHRIMKRKGISQIELAKNIGISRQRISKILEGNQDYRISTIVSLFHGLGETIGVISSSELNLLKSDSPAEWVKAINKADPENSQYEVTTSNTICTSDPTPKLDKKTKRKIDTKYK